MIRRLPVTAHPVGAAPAATTAADLPVDELRLLALLLAVPSLGKFATADAVDRLGHPGLAHVGRQLVGLVRDSGRLNTNRVVAWALRDASRELRAAVCTASLALGEVRNPHEALLAAADALGACSRCRSRGWRAALVTSRGRVCSGCIRRGRNVRIRLPEPPTHGRKWPVLGGAA